MNRNIVKGVLLATLFYAAGVNAQISAALSASKSEVLTFLGTDSAKLVFQNEGYLWYVDYAAATPQIIRLDAAANGILPSISPDGQWLTFATGVNTEDEATAGAKVWVMRLPGGTPVVVDSPAYQPRFIQDGTGLYVMYLSKGGVYLYDDVSCLTLKKKINTVSGNPEGSAITITQRGFTGGLSKDGRYLSTAVQRSRMLDLQNPGTFPLVHRMKMHYVNGLTVKDTILDSIQACNVSGSTSTQYTNAMLYLDFQFPNSSRYYTNLSIPGLDSWLFHQVLYIADNTPHYRRIFRVPAVSVANTGNGSIAAYQWDDSEWSTHPYFGTANTLYDRRVCVGADCSFPRSKKHEQLYVINFKDSTYLKVVQTTDSSAATTTDMQWPFLWAKLPSGFTEAPGWLPDSVVAIEQAPVKTPSRTFGIQMQGSRIAALSPIQSLTVYDIAGRAVATVKGLSRTTVELGSLGLASGVYTVRVKSVSGQTAALAWTVVR